MISVLWICTQNVTELRPHSICNSEAGTRSANTLLSGQHIQSPTWSLILCILENALYVLVVKDGFGLWDLGSALLSLTTWRYCSVVACPRLAEWNPCPHSRSFQLGWLQIGRSPVMSLFLAFRNFGRCFPLPPQCWEFPCGLRIVSILVFGGELFKSHSFKLSLPAASQEASETPSSPQFLLCFLHLFPTNSLTLLLCNPQFSFSSQISRSYQAFFQKLVYFLFFPLWL